MTFSSTMSLYRGRSCPCMDVSGALQRWVGNNAGVDTSGYRCQIGGSMCANIEVYMWKQTKNVEMC